MLWNSSLTVMDSLVVLYILLKYFISNLRFRVGFERKNILPARYGIAPWTLWMAPASLENGCRRRNTKHWVGPIYLRKVFFLCKILS